MCLKAGYILQKYTLEKYTAWSKAAAQSFWNICRRGTKNKGREGYSASACGCWKTEFCNVEHKLADLHKTLFEQNVGYLQLRTKFAHNNHKTNMN